MYRLACVVAFSTMLLASACGRSDPPQPPARQPVQQPDSPQPGPQQPEPEQPAVSPEPWRDVEAKTPQGWVALGREGRQELLKRVRDLPEDARYVADVASEKPPGPTKPDEAWQEWSSKVSGAVLYFLTPEQLSPMELLEQHGHNLIDSNGEQVQEGSLAWTNTEDGSVTVFTLQLEHGSYFVLGFSPAGDDGMESREQIRNWAMSVKGKES